MDTGFRSGELSGSEFNALSDREEQMRDEHDALADYQGEDHYRLP